MDKSFPIAVQAPQDAAAREALLDLVMGEIRHRRSSAKLREGRLASPGLTLGARDGAGRLVGTVQLWDVKAQGLRDAVLLGPLAVDPACQGAGIGAALMTEAIARAKAAGRSAIILVGDAAYYARFGFSAGPAGRLFMPGPFERHRLLALPLKNGALDEAHGTIRPDGKLAALPKQVRRVA